MRLKSKVFYWHRKNNISTSTSVCPSFTVTIIPPAHSGLFQLKNGHFCFIFRHFWYFGNVRKLLFLTLFWPFLGIFKCFRPLQLKWLRRYGQKINLSLLQFLPFFIISFKKPKNWKINIFIFFAESPKVFELQRHTIPSL